MNRFCETTESLEGKAQCIEQMFLDGSSRYVGLNI